MNDRPSLNVLGTPLVACSYDPLTGWYRDGCCHTDRQDAGSHVICARMSVEFLSRSLRHPSPASPDRCCGSLLKAAPSGPRSRLPHCCVHGPAARGGSLRDL
jgi:uncharacterized protein (DUF2237 family)